MSVTWFAWGAGVREMGKRLTWAEICKSAMFRGRWIAMDHCKYERNVDHPIEGDVVDSDENLTELCERIRGARRQGCAIVFCDRSK